MFPVYLNKPGFQAPDQGMYYLLSKNGVMMRVDRLFGSAFVKVDEVPHLQEQPEGINYNLPKVPGRIIAQAKKFFETVFREHRSESYLTLYYSKKLEQFRLWCPQQRVSYSSVNYERSDRIPVEETNAVEDGPGWQMLGTIHSHCDFSAFHSGTDIHDEESFDGLHITIGHVNQSSFSMVATVSCCGQRKTMQVEDVIEGVVGDGESVVEQHGTSGSYSRRREGRWNLALNPEDQAWADAHLEPLVDEWMKKVTKVVYTTFSKVDDDFEPRITHRHAQRTLFPDTVSSSEWGVTDSKSDIPAETAPRGSGFWSTWSKKWLRPFIG